MKHRVLLILTLVAVAIGAVVLLAGTTDLRHAEDLPTPAEAQEHERLAATLRGRGRPATATTSSDPDRSAGNARSALELDTERYMYVKAMRPDGAPAKAVLTYASGRPPHRRRGRVESAGGWYAIERAQLVAPVRIKLQPPAPAPGEAGLAPLVLDTASTTTKVLEVTLEAGRLVRGRVVDTEGQGQSGRRIDTLCMGLLLTGQHLQGRVGQITTGPGGVFELGGLPWLPVRLTVETGYAPEPQIEYELGGSDQSCEIEIPLSRSLEVRVRGPGGEPVEGALVRTIRRADSRVWSAHATTDAQGNATLTGLQPHVPLQLSAWKQDSALQTTVVEVDPDARTIPVALTEGVRVTGRVVNRSGHEVADVMVIAHPAGRGPASMRHQRLPDTEHTFALEGLSRGPCDIFAVSRSKGSVATPKLRVHAPAHDVVLELGAAHELHGAATGLAAGSLFVTWTDGVRQIGRGPGKGGAFTLDVPRDAAGVIYVAARDSAHFAYKHVEAGSSDVGILEVTEGVRIEGQFVDDEGMGVPYAHVRVRDGLLLVVAITDEHGCFTTSGLPRGDYELAVDASDGTHAPLATVRAPATDVRLRRP